MKRWIALLMAAVLTLCLSGCGNKKNIVYFGKEIKIGAIFLTIRRCAWVLAAALAPV